MKTDLHKTHVIHGLPVGKPRQTQRDRWRVRPAVARYRCWADLARLTVWGVNRKQRLLGPSAVHIVALFHDGPKGRVGFHTQKPDADNIAKAVLDALFLNDQLVSRLTVDKQWIRIGPSCVTVTVTVP